MKAINKPVIVVVPDGKKQKAMNLMLAYGATQVIEEKERLKESTDFIKQSALERFKFETEQIALTNKEKQKADEDAEENGSN